MGRRFEVMAPLQPLTGLGWCGRCAACAAVRRRPSFECGCPQTPKRAVCADGTGRGVFALVGTRRPFGTGPASPSCLEELGRRLAHALHYGGQLTLLPVLKHSHVLAQSVAMASRARRSMPVALNLPADVDAAGLTFFQALALVRSYLQHLVHTGDLAERSLTKMVREIANLATYMTHGLGRPVVADTTPGDLAAWIGARVGGRRHNGSEASAATQHTRRNAARLLFRVLRHLGLHIGDPTMDLPVPPRQPGITRPITGDDAVLARLACITNAEDTRLPSVLALGESGATTDEMPRVRIRDCDLDRALVYLSGNKHREPRTNPLSNWGCRQLRRRIDALTAAGAGPDTPVIYSGARGEESESPGASAALAVQRILELADLAGEPGLRPSSIPAGYGRRLWERHHDIGLVARALGCRTLDAAARAIAVKVIPSSHDGDPRLRDGHLDDDTQTVYQRGKARSGKRRSEKQPPKNARSRRPAPPDTAGDLRVWQAGK